MYAALLRAVNLGSHGRLAMPDLRRLCTDLGYNDVQTYLQSGNVVFAAPAVDPGQLEAEIEARLAQDLGLETPVMVRTHTQLATLVAGNPYLDREDDPTKLHVAFLADDPDPDRLAAFEVPPGQPEELTAADRALYLLYPNGVGRSKLSGSYIERRLGVASTSRNWRTVLALHELTAG